MPGRRARAVVGVLVAGILAACSGGAGEGGEDEDEGEVAPSGVLRLAVAGEIGLDPAGANPADPAALIVADLLYDGLTAVDDRGEVVPALAESWTTEAGSTAWTFRLSSAARTAGGEPVDAAMVVRSLSHAASGGDASLVAARLEPVVGYRDVVEGRSDTLAGVTAVDAGTVRIALTGPMATLPWLLSSPLLGVRDPQAAADDLAAVTGRFVARRERGVLRLEPREGVGAAVEGIELRSFGSVEAAFRALVEGDADWALRPADEADEALPEGLVDRSAPFQAVVFLGANASVPSLASGELRRAVALSLDREALVEAAFPGAAEPLATLVPAGGIGHRATACGDLCRSDRAAARTLVAAAFPAGGPPVLHLDVDDTPAQRRLADEVAHLLGDVGLTVEVRARPSADYEAALAAGE
ncbi:MAG: ABC transporter substrate-binding protein, partial [Acidimicrobiia bacterium]